MQFRSNVRHSGRRRALALKKAWGCKHYGLLGYYCTLTHLPAIPDANAGSPAKSPRRPRAERGWMQALRARKDRTPTAEQMVVGDAMKLSSTHWGDFQTASRLGGPLGPPSHGQPRVRFTPVRSPSEERPVILPAPIYSSNKWLLLTEIPKRTGKNFEKRKKCHAAPRCKRAPYGK